MLPLSSEHILCFLSFVVESLETFKRNADVHNLKVKIKGKANLLTGHGDP
jgi:hypothetical protein